MLVTTSGHFIDDNVYKSLFLQGGIIQASGTTIPAVSLAIK